MFLMQGYSNFAAAFSGSESPFPILKEKAVEKTSSFFVRLIKYQRDKYSSNQK